MATMARKALKAKEPVRLREKKLANGGASLYLDTYDHTTGKRQYEFLKLYLIPETTPGAKAQNTNTIAAANKIKAQRVIEYTSGGAGIIHTRAKMALSDLMARYAEKKRQAERGGKNAAVIKCVLKHLERYCPGAVLGKVDRDFCEGFLRYLKTAQNPHGGKLAKSTQREYYGKFTSALRWAESEGWIKANPATKADKELRPEPTESRREFLTVEEVKRLMATPCKSEAVKKAYLFSCFSGLRFSDIVTLTWANVKDRDGHRWIEKVMQKTQRNVSVPLQREAVSVMPSRESGADEGRIFNLPSLVYTNEVLRRWAAAAGIKKHLSFHTARHTFATLGLTAGADLYTVSRLLGHTNVTTTQIYAKIVDRKKEEAVSLLGGLFNE